MSNIRKAPLDVPSLEKLIDFSYFNNDEKNMTHELLNNSQIMNNSRFVPLEVQFCMEHGTCMQFLQQL
jgi:hypothetical protein